MSLGEPRAPIDAGGPLPGSTSVAMRLLAVNVLIAFTGLITGPLQARALGVSGRGELATITVPLMLIYVLGPFGLDAYLSRAAARRLPTGALIGSVGALVVGIGALIAAVGIVVVQLLPDQPDAVRTMLTIGCALAPVALLAGVLQALNIGLERWSAVLLARAITPVVAISAMTILYVVDALTVTTAALVTLVAVGPAALVVQLRVVRDARPLRIDRPLAQRGLAFGIRAWLAVLAAVMNARLDQLLLIALVSSHELGLYVIAVTLAGFATLVAEAIGLAIVPKIARGDHALGARAVRITIALALAVGVVLGLLVDPLLTLLFGADFAQATTMARILLAAGVPLAAMSILSAVATAAGHPGESARAQLVALCLTVPGLLLLVPVIGAEGAALVSLVAYTIAFVVLLARVCKLWSMPARHFLVVSRADLAWLARLVGERVGSLRG